MGVGSLSLYLKLLFETGCADISVRGRMGSGDAVGKHGILLKPTIILCRSLSEHPRRGRSAMCKVYCAGYHDRFRYAGEALRAAATSISPFRRWGMVRST